MSNIKKECMKVLRRAKGYVTSIDELRAINDIMVSLRNNNGINEFVATVVIEYIDACFKDEYKQLRMELEKYADKEYLKITKSIRREEV